MELSSLGVECALDTLTDFSEPIPQTGLPCQDGSSLICHALLTTMEGRPEQKQRILGDRGMVEGKNGRREERDKCSQDTK